MPTKKATKPNPRESRWTRHADTSRWNRDSFVTGMENPYAIDADDAAVIEREGVKLQWFTDTVYGDASYSQVAIAEQNGWERISVEDGFPGVARVEHGGQVLMARPMAIHKKAEREEKAAAEAAPLRLKQKAGEGDLPGISPEASRHPSARRSNKINRSFERLEIPGGE
jgi:hypothetical protein